MISSTTPPRSGSSSESSIPLLPFRTNLKGEGSMVPIWSANSIWLTMSRLGAEPANFCQHRLRIEQVDLAGAAILEQLDDGFRFTREMRRLRF